MPNFDCIVLGLGGVGSAALLACTEAGWKVLGIDQFPVAHDRGSSHGNTRIIRTAYFEHPDYVPLAQQSVKFWKQIEKTSGRNLLFQNGLIQIGRSTGHVIEGVLASVQKHDLSVKILTPPQSRARFPAFAINDDELAIVEKDAGYLMVEECVRAQVEIAVSRGATIDCDSGPVLWQRRGDLIEVSTATQTYKARRLVITTGAWSSNAMNELNLPLQIKRKSQFWFDVEDIAFEAIPTFFCETEKGCFYGFPSLEGVGMKVAEHSKGEWIENPDRIDRDILPAELERVQNFLRERLGFRSFKVRNHSVCMYTMTPDEHFIADRYPGADQVVFAAGLSGHGFKFTPVLGHYLVDLLLGKTDPAMDFLRHDRFS